MNLTEEDFYLSKEISEKTIKLKDHEVEDYINDSVKKFISSIDMSYFQNRSRVFEFLSHISTLFLNFNLNGDLYLLSEEQKERALLSRSIIYNIIQNLRDNTDGIKYTTQENLRSILRNFEENQFNK